MKSETTPTLKLTQLPNGGLEIEKALSFLEAQDCVRREPLILDDRETKALKDFLNDCHPTTTLA